MGSVDDLAEPLRGRVAELLELAGGTVTIVSGRRSFAEQAALRVRNGCPDVHSSPASTCRVPTAIPGTSKHEEGLAVDLGGDLGLAARLAPQVGLVASVDGEPWHFEPSGRVSMPERVAAAGGTDDGIVEGLVRAVRNATVKGLAAAGALTLVVMGGYRAVTGRSLAGATARAGTQVGLAAATGGAGAVATGAKAAGSKFPSTTPRSARR